MRSDGGDGVRRISAGSGGGGIRGGDGGVSDILHLDKSDGIDHRRRCFVDVVDAAAAADAVHRMAMIGGRGGVTLRMLIMMMMMT